MLWREIQNLVGEDPFVFPGKPSTVLIYLLTLILSHKCHLNDQLSVGTLSGGPA